MTTTINQNPSLVGKVSQTPAEFCQWLKGFFEISEADPSLDKDYVSPEQVQLIRSRLAEVFIPAPQTFWPNLQQYNVRGESVDNTEVVGVLYSS